MSIRTLAHQVDHYQDSCKRRKQLSIDIFYEAQRIFAGLLHNINIKDNAGFPSHHDDSRRPTSKNIFVTGALGYLGIAILRHLMERGGLVVYALVRCSDERIGYQRLETSCREAGWWKDEFKSRIK
jgi:hypothetical protein